jgi:hypothetical protein
MIFLFVRSSGFELTLRGQKILQDLEELLPKIENLVTSSVFDPKKEWSNFRISGPDNVCIAPGARSVLAGIEPEGAGFGRGRLHSSIAAIVPETIPPPCGEPRSALGTALGMSLFIGRYFFSFGNRPPCPRSGVDWRKRIQFPGYVSAHEQPGS